jgi:hypothetical protein
MNNMLAHEKAERIIEKTNDRFKCKTVIAANIRPDKIDHKIYGHHSSYCDDEYRIWGFISEAGWKLFMQQYRAEPCE